jgi:O-methyltransferase domain
MTEATPVEKLMMISTQFALARCLHVVAELGVADALDEAPQTAASLAAATSTHPGALGRVLRLLSANGVFEVAGDSVGHTPASRLLRREHPQSAGSLVQMLGMPLWRASFDALEHTVRTGLPAADQVAGGFWPYLAEHPAESRLFDKAMTAKAHGQVAGVLAAYDFANFGLIGDIGGGHGHLLQAVLDANPGAHGVLFDLPHVLQKADGVNSERLRLQAGDFFRDPLPVCDAYLLMEIIHDWGDEDATQILQAVRRVAPTHARLLVIESLIPDDPGPNWAKVLDVLMLTVLTGRQRTEREYAELLGAAGFQLERVIPTFANVSILEARPGVVGPVADMRVQGRASLSSAR